MIQSIEFLNTALALYNSHFCFLNVNINTVSTEKYVSVVIKDFFEGCCNLEILFYELFWCSEFNSRIKCQI